MTKRSKYDMPAVQNFAFGGIANPGQRAMLRGSDKSYLDARQKELDAFEAQRVAYNDALTKYQTEVYNPYKAQSEAYNAAAQKYNDEVYNPYKTQYDTYTKAIETYNAGDRAADYTGPEAPTLARTFDMTAPTDPVAFDKTAPVLPFKEEEVAARQKEAAGRAQKDASARGVAIEVASNPDRFNFGSMSVSNRFMAEGGEVMQDDPDDRTAESIIKDFEKFGYTKEEIMELADQVAAAGRGGDELLAYLSPESVEFLKSQGGSGTINPITGLPEFKGGVIGKIVNAVKRVFGRSSRAVPAAVAAGPAAEAAPTGPTAAELAAQLSEANKARDALSSKNALDLATLKEQQAAALKAQQEASTAAQQLAIQDALKADAEARAKAALPMSNAAAAINTPRAAISAAPSAAAAQNPVATSAFPSNLGAVGASTGIAKIDLGNLMGTPRPTSSGQRTMPTGQAPGQGGDTPISSVPVSQPMMYQNQGVGQVGQVGAVGDAGSINITRPASPIFGTSPISQGGAATDPKSYFAMSQTSDPGINAGTTALGSPDMPMYGAMNTMGAIGSNKNLSPTMLGGEQNAGYFTDRMGNQVIAPGMAPFRAPGFAKGGDIDLKALLAQNTETLSDEQPEEAINTNPVGTAQAFLADLNSAGKASPTRQSIKRTKTSPGGGATADKAMQMAYEDIAKGDLGAMKDRPPAMKNTESARSQMEELARVYQLKIRAAQNSARGLSADTFGAPTLEGPTLTKGKLTKKRFKDGGEAKKSGAESAKEPGIFSVNSYATDTSERMFPGQMGQDDERDAARHMLAAATLSKKFGPRTAEFLGKAYERTSSPESFFSMFGIGKPREDYEMDVHNNKVGAELAARATSQAELEKLVQAMAAKSQNKQVEGKSWTMSDEQKKNRKPQITTQPPEYRSEGSPVEGEESLDKYYAPKARPSTGMNRKKGPISQQLDSGEAYVNMAKGLTELPYDIAGAPVDIATMLMRPFGYSTEKPVMGSDFIKEKMTKLGVRPEPPADSTAKGFYTAGELLSNLTNPAGVTRSAVKGVKKTGEAATAVAKDFQDYNRQLSVPGASYAVRPTGSTLNMSKADQQVLDSGEIVRRTGSFSGAIIDSGKSGAGISSNTPVLQNIQKFWDGKAQNYFERQFGTPDDPISAALIGGKIKGGPVSDIKNFPKYITEQALVGKTRQKEGVNSDPEFVGPGAPETRFYPKFPEAIEDLTRRYDEATGLKGLLVTNEPGLTNPEYTNITSNLGAQRARETSSFIEDRMMGQGVRPDLINTQTDIVTRSEKDPTKIVGPSQGRKLLEEYEKSLKGEAADMSESTLTAIKKGEPIYDVLNMQPVIKQLFNPERINQYLETLPAREIDAMRFEDVVANTNKMFIDQDNMKALVDRIKSGKRVPDSVFSEGVSKPLLQFGKDSGLDGFAWKRIEKREATVPEGAYVGHSVGGYELGGPGYTKEKMEGFNTGLYQVYTLRDNRNRPVNTIEVKMLDENTPVVTQIKGNGRATGNVTAEKYDGAVLRFLQTYLKPAAIEEYDTLLTPLLQNYKTELGASPRTR